MKKTIISILMGIMFLASHAQDIHFSQYYESPLTLNPALTGAFSADHRFIANYKTQWASITNPYTTYAFSYDVGLMKKKLTTGFLGLGVNFFSDKAGDSQFGTTKADLSIAYHLTVGVSSYLSAAIQGGYTQNSMNQDALYWDNQYDGSGGFNTSLPSGENIGVQSFSNADLSAGILYSYYAPETNATSNDGFKFNIGAAFYHVTAPKHSFYELLDEQLYTKYCVHGRASIGLFSTNTAIIPSFAYFRQGPAQEINVGTNFRFMLKEESKYTGFIKEAALSIGAHYRVADAISPQILLEVSNYAIGCSYDVNTSTLKRASNGRGGFEIMIRYMNPNPFRYQMHETNKSFF
jgi:type IX secretion system PorP/SprF family membrane protein